MFVVSIPCGIFNKTSQSTIYLKKEKKEKRKHTKDHSFVQISSIRYFHIEAERITIK